MKIAEVSKTYGISADTLRYYERIGLLPAVHRNENGIRDYNDLDLRRVDFIKCMRIAALPLEVLIEYMALVQQGDQTVDARKEILIEQRDQVRGRINDLQQTLNLIDHKIEIYESIIRTKEKGILSSLE